MKHKPELVPVFDSNGTTVIGYMTQATVDFIAKHYGPMLNALARRAERGRKKKERSK